MLPKSNDPILTSLDSITRRLRSALLIETGFRWMVPVLFIAGFMVPLFPSTEIYLLLILAVVFAALSSVDEWKQINHSHAASRADAVLQLPDSLSAYVEYAEQEGRNRFQQAHLAHVLGQFGDGVTWRPAWPVWWKPASILIAPLVSFGLMLLVPLPNTRDVYQAVQPLPRHQSSASPLTMAADFIRQRGREELAVSLDQFAKKNVPSKEPDRRRFLSQLKEIQRELNAEEGRIAAQFLGDLLAKSKGVSAQSKTLADILKRARFDEASEFAKERNIDTPAGKTGSDIENEIIKALNDDRLKIRPAGAERTQPHQPSAELSRRLTAIADTFASPDQKTDLKKLANAEKAIAMIAKAISDEIERNIASQNAKAGNTPPRMSFRIRPEFIPPERTEGVTPLVAPGSGQVISAAMETQDTGIATVVSEQAYLNRAQRPSAPVPQERVPVDAAAHVRSYFEYLEKAYERP